MAKKGAKKKAAPTARGARQSRQVRARVLTGDVKRISYRCVGTASPCCKITDRSAHMEPGDVVVLIAVDTRVNIKFRHGSPFESGETSFTIAAGSFRVEVVKNVIGIPPVRFPYNDDCCAACRVGCPHPEGPPEMIVP